MPSYIYEYIKDKHGHLKGVVLATSAKHIGWSTCNLRKGDKFDKSLGLKIAEGRALKGKNSYKEDVRIPRVAYKYCKKMKERAKRYFKEQ